MNTTSRALLDAILVSDGEISAAERTTITGLLGLAPGLQLASVTEPSLTVTQKEAAALLGVDRTTIWRMKGMGILRTIEIAPGTLRYARAEVEKLAREGYRAMLTTKVQKLAA